jgi:hypothetical protein
LFILTELCGKAYLAKVSKNIDYLKTIISFSQKESTDFEKHDFTENPPSVLLNLIENTHHELLKRRAQAIINQQQLTHISKLEELLQ